MEVKQIHEQLFFCNLYLMTLVSGKLLLRIRKYLINNIFRGQTPVHDLKCLHLQSVS